MNDDVVEVPVDERPEPRRGAARNAVLGLGLVALVVMGGFLLQALSGGGGGSDSAEGAVRELADSISNEDLLGALAVIAPDEVGSLDRVVNTAFGKAEEYEIVDSAARPFAGFDLQVRDLELESEEMAPGFVKVSMTSGRIDAGTHPEGFSELMRDRGDIEPASTSVGLGDVFCEEGCPGGIDHPFLMAVEDGGRWYVSAAYTAFEYWRLAEGLPEPDLGSARALAAGGAESPEAAVEAMFEAAKTLDIERVGVLYPPDELGAAYDYRAAIAAALTENDIELPLFDSEGLELEATRNGAEANVTIEAGTLRFGDPESDETTVEFSGDGCAEVTNRYRFSGVPVGGSFPAELTEEDIEELEQLGLDPELIGDIGSEPEIEEMTYNTCGEEAGPFGFMPMPTLGEVPTGIRTVERDGRWYVSLVGTVVDGLEGTLEQLDRRAVYMMFGLAHRTEPEGAVAIGEAVEGELSSTLDFDVWSFQGHAGDEIILRVDSEGSSDEMFEDYAYPDLYGPDGERLWGSYAVGAPLFGLPEDGEYRIVVQGSGRYALRVDRADIPVLPVPGSVSGTIDALDAEAAVPMYAVDIPAGRKVEVRASDNVRIDMQGIGVTMADVDGMRGESVAFGRGPQNTVTLDDSEATRWLVAVWPNFDEPMFGPNGELISEPSLAPTEFTLTAEVVDGG